MNFGNFYVGLNAGSGVVKPFNNHATLSDNLIAHYALNESSGTALDSHTNGYDLTDNNTVTSRTGKIGNAREFDDANSEYLSIGDNADFSQTGDWTIVAWFEVDDTTGDKVVVSKWQGGGHRSYRLYVTGNQLELEVSNDGSSGGASSTTVTCSTSLSASTWYMALAYHDNGTEIGVSVNNANNATGAHTGGTHDGAAPFTIGERSGTDYMDGAVDLVSFYSRLLTAGEKSSHYNSGSGVAY